MSIEVLNKLRQQVAEAKAKLQADGQEALKSAFIEFLSANPEIKSIQWVQYTPYFNDGDVCKFGVNEFGLELTEEAAATMVDPKFLSYGTTICYEGHQYGILKDNTRAVQIKQDLLKFQKAVLDKDLFETIFGDHKLIVATTDGFKVSEHRHD